MAGHCSLYPPPTDAHWHMAGHCTLYPPPTDAQWHMAGHCTLYPPPTDAHGWIGNCFNVRHQQIRPVEFIYTICTYIAPIIIHLWAKFMNFCIKLSFWAPQPSPLLY